MTYIKSFEQFINESEEIEKKVKEDSKEKISLNERMYETVKAIYNEACLHESDEDPAHTFEAFIKESFLLMAEMTTRVLKENTDIAAMSAEAAMKKCNEKVIDDKIVSDKTYEYLNELMKEVKETYCEKMKEMMEENPAIAEIAAEALSKKKAESNNTNNID